MMMQIMTDDQLNEFSIVWQEYLTEHKVKELFDFWAPFNAYARASEYIETIEPIVDLTNLEFPQYAEFAVNEFRIASFLKFSQIDTERVLPTRINIQFTVPIAKMDKPLFDFLMNGTRINLVFAMMGFPAGYYRCDECITENVVKLLFIWRPFFSEYAKVSDDEQI